MRFSVRVPVLSEQIVVALPMVSQAASCRIKHLSLYIFFVLYAKLIVTASGRPSGIATTTIVTARMKAWMNPFTTSFWDGVVERSVAQIRITSATKVAPAATQPILPIYEVRVTKKNYEKLEIKREEEEKKCFTRGS